LTGRCHILFWRSPLSPLRRCGTARCTPRPLSKAGCGRKMPPPLPHSSHWQATLQVLHLSRPHKQCFALLVMFKCAVRFVQLPSRTRAPTWLIRGPIVLAEGWQDIRLVGAGRPEQSRCGPEAERVISQWMLHPITRAYETLSTLHQRNVAGPQSAAI
jgi:hypothetical protein